MTRGLAVSELSFGYRGRSIGRDVSFKVADGEIVCLLGANGGGKTTFFKTLLGLLPPLAGRVAVDGEDVASWTSQRRARVFGYAPQAGAGVFPYTVREIVMMGRVSRRGLLSGPTSSDHEATEAALATLGASALADKNWLRISGGERQLALIARALAQEPRILVLDEPTANLDFGNQLTVLRHVRRLAKSGLAVLFSTHHPEQAFACASQVAILHEGTLLRFGPAAEAITPETMRSVYGVDVDIVSVGSSVFCAPKAL